MKMLWCWRCRQEMPMLEAEEFALVQQARMHGMAVVEREARRRGRVLNLMPPDTLIARHHQPVLEMYWLLTGFAETNASAVWHHVVDQYGPPCPQCHKPLRTPQARFCVACGFGKDDATPDSLPLVQRRPALFRK